MPAPVAFALQAQFSCFFYDCTERKAFHKAVAIMHMEISLLLKVVGIGILVAVSSQILSKTGRDELSTWITVAGIVLVLLMLLGQIGQLFANIRSIFGI